MKNRVLFLSGAAGAAVIAIALALALAQSPSPARPAAKADFTVPYYDLREEIKQWTSVLGISQQPLSITHPQAGWTRADYGPSGGQVEVEAYSIQGAGHTLPLPGSEGYAIRFLGLDQG